MVDSVTGFTRIDAINDVIDYVGNENSNFRSMLEKNITRWQHLFYKLHDWKFAHKNGVADSISFALVADQSLYSLNTATIGAEMAAKDIETLYSQTDGKERSLHKTTLADLRRIDPGQQDTGSPTAYAPSGDRAIVVYPVPASADLSDTLFIDGKVLGVDLDTDTTPLDIPYEYQEVFIKWLIFKALKRERDKGADSELLEFKELFRSIVADDNSDLESNLRWATEAEHFTQHGHEVPLNRVLWETK